ncbi:shikimate dehydrogenase [Radiobacillus sp. PE A8.2]|uniref:shikimate dehydrogenase n=1 Tax=Radiobacillus sp. PE A8.2 TaxID=3380349 RepID=UPI00388E109B
MALSLGLIGQPIGHSLSPWIHNQFMEKLGIDGEYRLHETDLEHLAAQVELLKNEQVDGFNVTVPYKQAIIPFLDELDLDAKKIGAVNTVVCENGKWKGYNTDGYGFVRSLKSSFPDVSGKDKKVLVLGAGGAARGIYRALMNESLERVDIANRTSAKAELLLDLKEPAIATDILTFGEAEQQLFKYDVIIQTTSVGMKPNIEAQVIALTNLQAHTVVSDIVYQPLMTKLLQEAKQQGASIHFGHAMLLYQAQLAFEIWTDKKAPLDTILFQLEQRLRGN